MNNVQWEYRTLELSNDWASNVSILNELGAHGWELVAVFPAIVNGESSDVTAFKAVHTVSVTATAACFKRLKLSSAPLEELNADRTNTGTPLWTQQEAPRVASTLLRKSNPELCRDLLRLKARPMSTTEIREGVNSLIGYERLYSYNASKMLHTHMYGGNKCGFVKVGSKWSLKEWQHGSSTSQTSTE